jgi:hypothetical protein
MTLRPMESDLRPPEPRHAAWQPERRSLLRRLREWRRHRTPPTTFAGAVAMLVVRLVVIMSIATGIAWGISLLTGRSLSFGLLAVGALVLASAFFYSAGDTESPYYTDRAEREYRVNASFTMVLAGAVVIGLAFVIDALSG